MQTIVLYTVPGALLTGSGLLLLWAFGGWLPSNEGEAVLVVVATPVIGYLAHDVFRAIFQWTGGRRDGHHGGYGRSSRTVLAHIQEASSRSGIECTPEQAFLAWEITIHGDQVPTAFREHDGKSWFFLHTTWTTVGASAVAIASAIVAGVNLGYLIAGPIAAFELILAVVMYKRGQWNYNSLNKQEIAFVAVHEKPFLESLEQIVSKT